MSDQKFILNVDDDWKRQAQEEKKRLAEQEQKRKEAAAAAPAPTTPAAPAGVADVEELEAGDEKTPFGGLVSTILHQTLMYLSAANRAPMQSLDGARMFVDMLGTLDEKTKGNLSGEEQRLLDTALYQARNQFVAVASQYIGP